MRRRRGEIKRSNSRWGDTITEGKKGHLNFLATQAIRDIHSDGVAGVMVGQPRLMPLMYTDRDRGDGSKEQRPPSRVAVFTIDYATVCSACMHLHRIALCISDRGSSNDIASIVGGALERIFQPLRDQIDHHIPSCTAVVWEEEHAPNHKAAKALIHRYQALRLVLKPGRMLAPSRLLTHLREGAYVRKFAEPSDDLHHIACLSSVRACCGLRLRPRSCGRPSLPC